MSRRATLSLLACGVFLALLLGLGIAVQHSPAAEPEPTPVPTAEPEAAPGKRALDLGCGSGILGIAALLLGCERVLGCDIDPKAPEAARRNAALNGLGEDRFSACAGDLLADEGLRRRLGGGYDVVLANIVADVIIPLSAFARRFMADGAAFLCSGIIDDRRAEVENALRRNGFEVLRHYHEDEWNCYLCK